MTGADLRASILQAAVQGKLVPQDKDDEPASILLERIRAERAELVKQKKVRAPKGGESVIMRYEDGTVWEQRGKNAAVEITDEIPFDIPDGWEWARLDCLADYKKGPFGSALTKSMFVPDGKKSVKVYEQRNAIEKDWTLSRYFIPRDYYEKLKGFTVKPGDIIVSCAGTIGESYVLPNDARQGIINQALMRIVLFDRRIESFYLYYFDFVLKEEARLNSKGSAIKNIPPFAILKNMLMPIPPIGEQKRIVAKLDELEELVERYDKLDRERTALNAAIAGDMRASILQAAVQGALTEREPTDEPASVLLERIRKERRELVKQKKARAPKGGESVIWRADDGTVWEQRGKGAAVEITDEVPFDIPDGWEWARLETVAILSGGITPKKTELSTKGMIPYFKVSDMNALGNEKYLSVTAQYVNDSYCGKVFRANSIVYPKNGGAVLTNKRRRLSVDSVVDLNTGVCTPYLSDLVEYIELFMLGVDFGKMYKGTAVPTVNMTMVGSLLLPVPSLAEQQRIVAKLDAMLPKVEKLDELLN